MMDKVFKNIIESFLQNKMSLKYNQSLLINIF